MLKQKDVAGKKVWASCEFQKKTKKKQKRKTISIF